jgi:hypothetical protein
MLSVRSMLLPAALGSLCACASPTERALSYAQTRGMTASVIQGTAFRHQAFTFRSPPAPGSAPDAALYVFIEGDGSPWIDAGSKIARNPTPHRPLALELAAATSHPVLYLGRPCYFEIRLDANCTPDVWTSGRYSRAVVDSMVAAVNRYTAAGHDPELVLIGYSGGGTLAVLMAAQLPHTRAVITIAANLDVEAWARWHRYLPLAQSEDPASSPPLPDSLRQWHLVGGKDDNVPEALDLGYFKALRADQVWRYPDFGHACCWAEKWQSILARIDLALASSR